MARIDQQPTEDVAPISPRRRRAAWIAILTIGLVSGSALVAVPAIASSGGAPTGDRVIVCTSGVVEDGDIQTSSASATRVADDDTTPLPEGCEER